MRHSSAATSSPWDATHCSTVRTTRSLILGIHSSVEVASNAW